MICIVNFGSKKTPQISTIVSALGFENRIMQWDASWEFDFPKVSGIIFSGSPVLLSEVDLQPYYQKYNFITGISVPVLGICFGHQLLGILHGANVFMGKAIRTSVNIEVIKNDSLFKGLDKVMVMAEDHTEGITLPDGFIHLAKSADYEIEAMKHAQKTIYGVQFHPEISGEHGKILLRNFCEMC